MKFALTFACLATAALTSAEYDPPLDHTYSTLEKGRGNYIRGQSHHPLGGLREKSSHGEGATDFSSNPISESFMGNPKDMADPQEQRVSEGSAFSKIFAQKDDKNNVLFDGAAFSKEKFMEGKRNPRKVRYSFGLEYSISK